MGAPMKSASFMSNPHQTASAPWEIKRSPSGEPYLRRLIPWTGGIAFVGIIAWGLWPKPILIETGVVARGPLTVRVSEEGKTRIRNRYIVAAAVAGKMRRVTLKPGDEVIAGKTVMAFIEPMPIPLLDFRARTQAEALVSMHEAARKQAVASMEVRESAFKLAEVDRNRLRAVTREGAVSQADRDRIEVEALMRAAEWRATEFSIQVIDHELAQARATLDRSDSSNADHLVEVKSPVSGRVLKVFQESEVAVTPGTSILEIGDPADIEIEAEILSSDTVAILPGDAVEIDQWGGELPLQGRVRRIEPAAFTKISALGVEEQRVIVLISLVDLPEAAKALGDRFRIEARIAVWHHDDVLVVPSGALFREGNAWKTYIFRDGKAQLGSIEVGHSDGRFTEILSGLRVGDEVLLHPPDNLKDGSSIQKRQR
jgi:HlyD family secretion protein